MLDRRHFLSAAATGVAASLALRGNLFAQLEKIPPLPDRSLLDTNEDAFWAEMRKQFIIPEDEVYLNNGTVGSSPAPVLRAIFDGYNTTEKMDQQDPEDYPIWGYAAWNEFRDPLAAIVGCKRDEIALLRNATEANSYIANGIDMKPGDEVADDRSGTSGRRASVGLESKALWDRHQEDHAAPTRERCRTSSESVQRRDHAADASVVLQPYHYLFWSGVARERARRLGAYERNSVGRRRSARSGHDAAQHQRTRLRHVFLEPA
jgi:hypothetical protein